MERAHARAQSPGGDDAELSTEYDDVSGRARTQLNISIQIIDSIVPFNAIIATNSPSW